MNNCKQPFQNQLAIDLSTACVTFAEETYGHTGNKMWDKMFVMAALRLKITDNEVPSSTNNDATASAFSFGYNNPLLDLGPACCQNIGTLREALRLVVTQNPGTCTEHWSEPGVARMLHFFSAVGTSSGGMEWNLDVVSQFLAADFSHLNWQLVARSLDFSEFSIRGPKQLEVLLSLYRSGARGRQLPLDAMTAETCRNRSGQLSLLRHLLAVSPNNYNFHLDAEEAPQR
jgi:hypothetical protein